MKSITRSYDRADDWQHFNCTSELTVTFTSTNKRAKESRGIRTMFWFAHPEGFTYSLDKASAILLFLLTMTSEQLSCICLIEIAVFVNCLCWKVFNISKQLPGRRLPCDLYYIPFFFVFGIRQLFSYLCCFTRESISPQAERSPRMVIIKTGYSKICRCNRPPGGCRDRDAALI